jgi:type I restriction enzyme, S subunit
MPFELPQGWEWSRVGEITSVVTSGSRNWQSLYSDKGATFIRSQDIKLDQLCFANRAFVDVSKAKEGKRTLVNQHDWLIIITGANVGKCAYLHEYPGEAYVSQHVALMRPVIKDIGVFGHNWLIAELGGRGLLSKFIYGDKPGLNLPHLRNLLIPIAPLNEQQAIVTKVEKLFALCDQLEAQFNRNKIHAEQLMQAVLKEAFQSITH